MTEQLEGDELSHMEQAFPLDQLNALARLESYNKHYYRPSNYVHKWWARRLGSVFRTILLFTFLDEGQGIWPRYYENSNFGKVVLDPFMGGGTTVTEALRLGCKVIGSDLNPVAWWTVRQAVSPVTPEALDAAFAEIEAAVADELLALYHTTCPACHGQADTVHVLWTKLAPCVGCGHDVALHTSHVLQRQAKQAIVFCPACDHVFPTQVLDQNIACPRCEHGFDPKRGVIRSSVFTCPQCGEGQTMLEATRAAGRVLDQKMQALIVLCPEHGQGFKEPGHDDLARYQEAVSAFERRRGNLLYPRTEIPPGLKTNDLLNHNYRYWHELFNARQLLALDKLLRSIEALEDTSVRDLMITLFSSSLEFNNLFCSYKGGHARRPGAVRHIFSHHAFVLPKQPLENNLWGVDRSSGSFSALYYSRLRRSREYAQAPVERVVRRGKVVDQVPIEGEKIAAAHAETFADLDEGANVMLLCQDSARLDRVPDGSVDAVITDPPYFDNVQYSELADFFYVWLRLALKDRYQEFSPPLTPKSAEVVANPERDKDADDYLAGMAAVLAECNRVLKDDGLLAFSFHHKDPAAWASVLQAVLDAGFRVHDTYPVLAEMGRSVHIQGQEAMEYDAIIFCRKRTPAPAIEWQELEQRIWERAHRVQTQLARANGAVSKMETAVIVMGKCLEFFSQHYPDVTRDGLRVTAKEAIANMKSIIDEMTALQQPYARVIQPRLFKEADE
jgi:adenine-specific DNA methylase